MQSELQMMSKTLDLDPIVLDNIDPTSEWGRRLKNMCLRLILISTWL